MNTKNRLLFPVGMDGWATADLNKKPDSVRGRTRRMFRSANKQLCTAYYSTLADVNIWPLNNTNLCISLQFAGPASAGLRWQDKRLSL